MFHDSGYDNLAHEECFMIVTMIILLMKDVSKSVVLVESNIFLIYVAKMEKKTVMIPSGA